MKTALDKIITVSGKGGLFKVISGGKNVVIAESIIDGQRIPIHSSQKVSTLSDISMFTTDEDISLREVLENAKKVFNSEQGPSHKAKVRTSEKPCWKYCPTMIKKGFTRVICVSFFNGIICCKANPC